MKNINMTSFERMPNRQCGVALVITLILMVLIAVIGVASLRTTALEEKMAANVQQSTRAFESAESGIRAALSDTANFSVYNDEDNPLTPDQFVFTAGNTDADLTGTADVEVSFAGWSTPKRASGFSVVHFQTANFEVKATGKAPGNAKAVIAQGLGQIVNKEQ